MIRKVSVRLPELYIMDLDGLVKEGRFYSRNQAATYAIFQLLKKEVWANFPDNRLSNSTEDLVPLNKRPYEIISKSSGSAYAPTPNHPSQNTPLEKSQTVRPFSPLMLSFQC